MPHIGSRFRNLVCPFKVSLCKVKPTSGSKVDHLGFLELASGTDPIVDIVAIHGLQGHRENTWMTDGGTLWLRDFLPADLSNARILTYGYDADTRSPECVSTQTMRRHAEGFAWALARTRRGNPRRPIIFLAHDLGCIILQWALALCHNQTLQSKCELRDILISTEAILFFGTPDFGIEVSLLEAISHLASMYIGAKDVMVKDLRSNSSELEDIQSRYVEASADINSTFLCGEYAAGSLDFSTSSNRNPAAIVLHASLRDMVKFSVKANDNYQTVLQYLKDYVENAVEDIKERWFTEDNRRSAAKEEPVSEVSMFPKSCPPAWRMYIERTHVQSLITQNLLPAQPTDRQPRCILHGIGGSGKTQLALKWIQEHETRFTRVIYVDASSKTQLEMDLKRSIRCLGLEYSKMSWKDAIAYLEGKEKGWLLFLDNADAPDLDLTPYIPKSTHGAVMLTTRNNKSVNYAPDGAVPVGPLEEAEALSLLHKVAEVTPASDAKSLEIVRELGMLALAITQAGVYIRATRRLEDYLDIFRKSRRRLLRRKPEFGSEYTSSTYTAFNLSFRKLKTKPQEFLKLCAFLHHSLIPLSLFERSVGSGFTTYTVLESCPPPKSDQRSISKLKAVFGETWDADGFQEIVDSASKASFIDVSTDGLFYTVHPLLQTYIKDSLVGLENEHYCRVTAQLILGAIRPPDGNNAQLWQLLPHANSIPRQVQSKDVAHVLAFYTLYDSLGSWTACRDLLQSAQAALQLIQDEGHEESMYIDTKLAETLRSCGQWEEAEKLQRDLLARRLKVSGDRHPDTITAMNNLASILYSRGQLEEAETTQQKVLALRLEISGPRHSDAIVAMNNLAATLRGRGQLDEAEKMQRD
ncbi:related to kinesin light chain, partial [Serendipita indica DSM 11827]